MAETTANDAPHETPVVTKFLRARPQEPRSPSSWRRARSQG